jgi:UDP-GlcNAc:undecaprenyl-phosphate/decaprenyl-phosphate GlcNAc-1-phosphate transferase
MYTYALAFITPLLISFFATPFAKKFAKAVGAIDIPKDNRRIHQAPIPRLGGLAILISSIASVFFFVDLSRDIYAILIGGIIIAISGAIDDIKPMSAKLKLLFQIIAAGVLIYGGIRIEFFRNPFSVGSYISLGIMAIPVTLFWVVGITNTVNLIDGMDGLSAGVSAISALSFAVISYLLGDANITILSLVIAGAALGFLPYNFNPASIFMGDTGALYLGFMLSAIAIEGAVKGAAAVAIVIPILTLGLPVFDTTFAILRRYKNKRPIMEADRGHLHHRLFDLGLSQKRTVIILYIISTIFGLSAIIMSQLTFLSGIVFLIAIFAIVIISMLKLRELGKKFKKR